MDNRLSTRPPQGLTNNHPMTSPQSPTFDQWVHYCFTQGRSDFKGISPDGDAAREARESLFHGIDRTLLTTYLTRLFESPAFIVERYTDDQIADAVWFIFGCGSGYIGEMRHGSVAPDLQVRCVRSLAVFYTDLLDHVCGRRGTDPDAELINNVEVDGAVYMMWDMDHLEGTVMFPDKHPHLVEPGIELLRTVLIRCRTSACRVSALHAIGHIYCIHNYSGSKTIAVRLQRMVDEFVKSNELPEWLADYAVAAREGAVQ